VFKIVSILAQSESSRSFVLKTNRNQSLLCPVKFQLLVMKGLMKMKQNSVRLGRF